MSPVVDATTEDRAESIAATVDAWSVVQSFYANLAGGRPNAAFALCSDDIEWNEAEGNPLADRNP